MALDSSLRRAQKTKPIFLSLGANLGNRAATIKSAISDLSKWISNITASSFYETEPVGNKDQACFINCVIRGRTKLSPLNLLKKCKALEIAAGRDIFDKKSQQIPRPLDIDILFYGDRVIRRFNLTIPHLRLHLRRFVLVPLTEIAPDIIHLVLKKTAAELLMECTDTSIVRAL